MTVWWWWWWWGGGREQEEYKVVNEPPVPDHQSPVPDGSELTVPDDQMPVPKEGEPTLPDGGESARPEVGGLDRPNSSSRQSIRRQRRRSSRAQHPAAFLLDYLWVVALVLILSVTVLSNRLPGNCLLFMQKFFVTDGKIQDSIKIEILQII